MDFHHDGEPSSAFTASEGRPRTSKTRRDSASASASLSRPLKPVPQLRRRRTEAGISGRPEAPETIVIGKSITYPPPPDSQFRRIWYYIDGPQLMRLPVAPPPEDVLPEFKWSVPGLTRYYGKRYPLLFVWGLYATALVCWLGIICIPLSSGAGYAVKEPPSTSTEGAGRPPPLITIPINYTVYIFVLFPFYVLSGTLCVGYYFHSYSPEFWLLRAWDFFFCFIPMMVIPVAANHIMYKYQPEIIESKIWVFWTIILGCSWGICYIGILNFRKQRKWTVFTHSRRASLASSPDGAAAKGASSDTENPRLSTTEKSRGSMARHHHHDPRCSPEAAADPYGKPEPMPFRTMFWMLGHIVQLLCLYYAGQILTYVYFEHAPYHPIVELICIHVFTIGFKMVSRLSGNYLGLKLKVTHLAVAGDMFSTLLHSMFLNNLYTVDQSSSWWVIPIFGVLYGIQRFIMITLRLTNLWQALRKHLWKTMVSGWKKLHQSPSPPTETPNTAQRSEEPDGLEAGTNVHLENFSEDAEDAAFSYPLPDLEARDVVNAGADSDLGSRRYSEVGTPPPRISVKSSSFEDRKNPSPTADIVEGFRSLPRPRADSSASFRPRAGTTGADALARPRADSSGAMALSRRMSNSNGTAGGTMPRIIRSGPLTPKQGQGSNTSVSTGQRMNASNGNPQIAKTQLAAPGEFEPEIAEEEDLRDITRNASEATPHPNGKTNPLSHHPRRPSTASSRFSTTEPHPDTWPSYVHLHLLSEAHGCVARGLTIIAFISSLQLLRYGPNARHYHTLAPYFIHDSAYTAIVTQTCITFAAELVASALGHWWLYATTGITVWQEYRRFVGMYPEVAVFEALTLFHVLLDSTFMLIKLEF